mmetsp:Transcript_112943/g.274270  ORF Transcript_112943/g.274270 Transcript_112943/m.274270 type:complete len:232 (-) Transcript_112943:427-1122(-)
MRQSEGPLHTRGQLDVRLAGHLRLWPARLEACGEERRCSHGAGLPPRAHCQLLSHNGGSQEGIVLARIARSLPRLRRPAPAPGGGRLLGGRHGVLAGPGAGEEAGAAEGQGPRRCPALVPMDELDVQHARILPPRLRPDTGSKTARTHGLCGRYRLPRARGPEQEVVQGKRRELRGLRLLAPPRPHSLSLLRWRGGAGQGQRTTPLLRGRRLRVNPGRQRGCRTEGGGLRG